MTRKTTQKLTEKADNQAGTRERLIVAGAEVFAEKGFRRATVREIVGRAEANLNAVNYHFGDKQGLYEAVLEWVHQHRGHEEEATLATDATLPAETRLFRFILAFLRRALGTKDQPYMHRLMALEMAEPTAALDMVVEQVIRPRFNLLTGLLGEITEGTLTEDQLRLCSESVVGQCVHLVMARPIVQRLIPDLKYTPEELELLAQHVTGFTLAALRELTRAKPVEPTPAGKETS